MFFLQANGSVAQEIEPLGPLIQRYFISINTSVKLNDSCSANKILSCLFYSKVKLMAIFDHNAVQESQLTFKLV
jgi:hypothetical protein